MSTVGLDEEMVRKYIRDQEQEDQRLDQLKLGVDAIGLNHLMYSTPDAAGVSDGACAVYCWCFRH